MQVYSLGIAVQGLGIKVYDLGIKAWVYGLPGKPNYNNEGLP